MPCWMAWTAWTACCPRSSSLGHVDGDLPRLGFLALGEGEPQHPILEVRLDLVRGHHAGQREGPCERAVRALDTMVALALDLVAPLPLAAQREHVVLDADVDFLR